MTINKERATKAIKSAKREFDNAVRCAEARDHAGALKYLQEGMEYAVKAVLLAYGMDYPKIHEVGRFLDEIEAKCPPWFRKMIPALAAVTDSLARGRPKFRYPYEYPPGEYAEVVAKVLPKARKTFDGCQRLIKELFG